MPREEIMGEEDDVSGDSENIIGALVRQLQQPGGRFMSPGQRARAGGVRSGGTVGNPRFALANLQNQVGGAGDNKLRAPLGLGTHVFTDTTPTTHKFIVEPQEAFRGERLIVDVGADAATAGVLASVDEILVGSLPQTPSTEFGIPAVMFRADATYAGMQWQICPAGTKIIVEVSISGTLAEAETATVQVGVYGEWIR